LHQPRNWSKCNWYKWLATPKARRPSQFNWWWNNNITQSCFTECWLVNSLQSRMPFEDCPFKLFAMSKALQFD
jgi:hypothetical protein